MNLGRTTPQKLVIVVGEPKALYSTLESLLFEIIFGLN
jgi:hypothetical protein